MEGRPRVSVSDDPVETDLVEIGRFELEHLKDTIAVDLICGCLDLLVLPWSAPELGRDQSLTVLVEKVECWQMGTARDLN